MGCIKCTACVQLDKAVCHFIRPKSVKLLFNSPWSQCLPNNFIINRVAVLTFGALQVAIGILLVLLDIADFVFGRSWCDSAAFSTIFGSGIWSGIFFILTGTFGIVAGQHIPPHQTPQSRRCYLITTLVLSIFGLLLALVLTPVAVLMIGVTEYCYYPEQANGFAVGFSIGHAFLFGVMFVINLGQLISASVNIHKLPSTVSLATIIMTTTTGAPDPRAIATAVHTHPAAITTPANGSLPPAYTTQQQAYVQQAVGTHLK